MKRKTLSLAIFAVLLTLAPHSQLTAQEPEKSEKDAKPDAKPAPETPAPKEDSSVTDHTIKIDGQTITYKATASTTLIKDDKGEPTASIFSVAYTRTDGKDKDSKDKDARDKDAKDKDLSQRPIAFVYNGGPGSSSIWVHMGAFGPRRVVTTDAGPTPPPPFKMVDNAESLLDKTDLVFIDPVGTGFSRSVGKAKDKDFWGVDEDVKSLAQFISTYVSRNNRWNSPKFLIGESYGTFRSAALGDYLQSHDGMYLNGIVLISSVLDLGTVSFNPGNDMPFVFYLPSYAATAAYHKMLKDPPADLNAFVAEARQFAVTEYAAALMKGANLPATEKSDIARKLSRFTGLSEDYLVKANLRVTLSQFMVELQRSRGLSTGRLDARFSGPQADLLAENASSDPQSDAVEGAFVAAFNNYIREDLKFGKDLTYKPLSFEANGAWNWKHGSSDGFPGSPNVEPNLLNALITNPHLHVEVENGLYDLATPFLATEYTMSHLNLPEDLQKNVKLQYYDAGHMMYLHEADLAKLKTNIATFLDNATRQ